MKIIPTYRVFVLIKPNQGHSKNKEYYKILISNVMFFKKRYLVYIKNCFVKHDCFYIAAIQLNAKKEVVT